MERITWAVVSTEGNDKPGAPSTSRAWTRSNGSPAEHDRQAELIRRGRSIMDLVGGEAKSLQRRLGSGDRDKLDAWFTSVRELEGRLVANEAWIRHPKPKVSLEPPVNVPRNNEVAVERIFLDIVHMALASDSTEMQGLDVGG